MLAIGHSAQSIFSGRSDETSNFQAAKDKAQFNTLLPAAIEFIEGSSSGTTLLESKKYEPINASPKQQRAELPKTPSANVPSSSKSLYPGKIEIGWPQAVKKHGNGLHNSGNTCFLNSALQCLLHTPPLLNILQSHMRSTCPVPSNTFCMACSLKSVAVKSFDGPKAFPPAEITSNLKTIAKHLRKGRQEDSHEFLRYAIDALQKSCLTGQSPKLDPKIQETTWVHKIFGGRLRSRVTCKECNYNSDTFDRVLDLSVDIHGQNSLPNALRKFVAPDHLKGADKYKCEKCKKPVNAEKRFSIHEAPTVLTIHLKRFSPLGKKIGHQLNYDEHLSLAPYMSEGAYGPTYSLYGVVCHQGGGPNSGHYFAFVKAHNGSWMEMNDESVSRQSKVSIRKDAYILFYVQDKGEALKAVTSTLSMMTPSSVVNGKKRKAAASHDDEDVGVRANGSKPIGPVRPTLTPAQALDAKRQKMDPQAGKLAQAIAKTNQPSASMNSLMAYGSDDETGDDDESENEPIKRASDGAVLINSPSNSNKGMLPSLPPSFGNSHRDNRNGGGGGGGQRQWNKSRPPAIVNQVRGSNHNRAPGNPFAVRGGNNLHSSGGNRRNGVKNNMRGRGGRGGGGGHRGRY